MEATTKSRTQPAPDSPGGLVRRAYHKLLEVPGLASAFRHAQSDYATVFMFHRFRDGAPGETGIDSRRLREGLEYLRRDAFEFVSLRDLLRRLSGDGPRLRGAVAFTIDDGYRDQAEIAAPIFRDYDCPVTTFLTTGFVDGALWLWWDQVEYVFDNTRRRSLTVSLDGTTLQYDLASGLPRRKMSSDFAERCKTIGDGEKHSAIARLAREADVDLTEKAPPRYAPMTWDDVRDCERRGMDFGAHTVTHPILSQVSRERAEHEISESWRRLAAEVTNPIPIFCYPNGLRGRSAFGRRDDFGHREIAILRKLGFQGALSSEPGFAVPRLFQRRSDEAFTIGRLTFPEERSVLAQYAGGIERFKQIYRSK